MKVLVTEGKLDHGAILDTISSCEQNGIQCIADDENAQFLFYDPANKKYATSKDLDAAGTSIHKVLGDKKLYDQSMLDAVGEKFHEFSLRWDALQKEPPEEVYKTKKCSIVRAQNMAESVSVGECRMTDKMADWYRDAYPTDSEMADDMDCVGSTFADLWKALNRGEDVYDVIGADDSIVRERVFQKLSELTKKSYRTIYEKWMMASESGDGDLVPLDAARMDAVRHGEREPYAYDDDDEWGDDADEFRPVYDQFEENMESAVVYWKDRGVKPMILDNVHDLEGALNELEFMCNREPEGDLPEISEIKIGNKVYDEMEIDKARNEMETSEMYTEEYDDYDDPNDWSASEGEVEIVWDTDDYEDFGIFRGEGSTYVVDYDMVDTHNDLINEVCRQIGKEYPDLDFEPYDFTIVNEDEFWEQRGGNPGKLDDDDDLYMEGQDDVVEGIPDWATTYIMYGDMTEDMTDDDVQLVEDFIGELAEQGISLIEPIDGTENEFNSHPAFGQPCGTVDWSCTVD